MPFIDCLLPERCYFKAIYHIKYFLISNLGDRYHYFSSFANGDARKLSHMPKDTQLVN